VSSDGKFLASIVTAIATIIAKRPLAISIETIIFLRSNRSVITPAGKVKTNHGNLLAIAIDAIKSGDRVTADASQGYAT
jgi:hypothetical protein